MISKKRSTLVTYFYPDVNTVIMGQFSLVSWNLALTAPSHQAPEWWDSDHNGNQLLDEIERYQPDFICLQEMPSRNFTELIMDEYAYSAPSESHSGLVSTFIHRGKIADKDVKLESQFNLPSASGALLHLDTQPLMIFSLHLAPYKNNAPARQQYLSSLVSQLPSGPLILAGDMNMREAETSFVTDTLGLQDAYQVINPGKEHYATWDSTVNLYHKDGFTFRARFDRVFTREIAPVSFKVIGTEVQTNEHHYLSDHFGIYCEFDW